MRYTLDSLNNNSHRNFTDQSRSLYLLKHPKIQVKPNKRNKKVTPHRILGTRRRTGE